LLLINYVALFFFCSFASSERYFFPLAENTSFPRQFLRYRFVMWRKTTQIICKGKWYHFRCAQKKAHNYETDIVKTKRKLSWKYHSCLLLLNSTAMRVSWEKSAHVDASEWQTWISHLSVVLRRKKRVFHQNKKSNTTIIRLVFHEKLNELCVRTFCSPFPLFVFQIRSRTQFVEKLYSDLRLKLWEHNLMSLSH
jgi:hypothetical protein